MNPKRIGTLSATLLLFSCSTQTPSQNKKSMVDSVVFKSRPWNKPNIHTCWEFISEDTKNFREEFKKITVEAFKESIVQLVGWDTCLPNEKDSLHLFIYDDNGSKSNPAFNKAIKDLISRNDNEVAGSGHPRLDENISPNQSFLRVILNRTFLNADPQFIPLLKAFTPNGIHNLGVSSSLHEIGHALGLRHEDSHPADSCDIPNNEDDYKEPLDDDIAISAYNPFSFMSRCYYRSFNYDLGMVLPNKKDIEGLNAYYADLKPGK